MKKILLAYDASPDAELALEELHRCGLGEHTQVRVLTIGDDRCFSEPEPFCPPRGEADAAELDEVRALATERAVAARDRLRAARPGWEVHALPELGEARRVLL